jgi:hypothetical protein
LRGLAACHVVSKATVEDFHGAAATQYNCFAQIIEVAAEMKRLGWILLILMAAAPASAARKLTVQQLQDLLQSLHQANTADAAEADELMQVELTEELTKSTMDSLTSLVPGPLSADQMYVLEARSAMLAPPAADLPSAPAPDAAAEKALLDKAIDYATKTYAQLPHLTATKTTFRFQDLLKPPAAANSGPANGGPFIYYVGNTDTQVASQGGAEILSGAKETTPWGANGQIASLGQDPVLSTVVEEAQATGKISWLRWETVNGRQTAVFSFTVEKKKSHYALNDCCFPNTDQDRMNMVNQDLQPGMAGNIAASENWSPYKVTAPYHGELFVDAQNGTVVRLITEAELKPFETVHEQDTRIDYGEVTINGKPLVVPVGMIVDTAVFPGNTDAHGNRINLRTLFIADYKDYQ